jgi:hypothetical protein
MGGYESLIASTKVLRGGDSNTVTQTPHRTRCRRICPHPDSYYASKPAR